jgi:hypothetical protein
VLKFNVGRYRSGFVTDAEVVLRNRTDVATDDCIHDRPATDETEEAVVTTVSTVIVVVVISR